jgi:tetratricopeptide (TPR) repeat protein
MCIGKRNLLQVIICVAAGGMLSIAGCRAGNDRPATPRMLGTLEGFTATGPAKGECSESMPVTIHAAQDTAFNGDRTVLHRLVGGVGAGLRGDCSKLSTIVVTGRVGDREIYQGITSKQSDWVLIDVAVAAGTPAATVAAEVPTATDASAVAGRCDELAAHPDDPGRPSSIAGIADQALNPELAIESCMMAVEQNPDNSRLAFQLARSLLAGGLVNDAEPFLRDAANAKYAAALAYLGDIEENQEKALAFYKAAAAGGFKPAERVLTEAKSLMEKHQNEANQTRQTPAANVGYGEPLEREMRAALERAMVEEGGTRRRPGEIAAESPINGFSINITRFEKLGCEPAGDGAGYFCSYNYRASIRAFTKERSAAAERHNEAINMLLKMQLGGRNETGGTETRRFVKDRVGWNAFME